MGGDGGESDRLIASNHAIEPIADLAHPDGLHHRQGGIEVERPQSLYFLDGAACEHHLEAPRNAGAQHVAVRVQHETLDAPALQQPGLQLVLKGR